VTHAVRDIAPGVRQLTISSAVTIHTYLIETAGGIVAFDAGIQGAGRAILAAAGGAVAHVVLSHGHVEHRGAASELGAPIYCHADEVADAEGPGGQQYIDWGLIPPTRRGLPALHAAWDGGPVSVAGTVADGELVEDFRVVHLPGHAPGLIALYRESDRLLIAPDLLYTIDTENCGDGPARVPHPAFNWDTALARASITKVRHLSPSSLWTGHGRHLTGDIDRQLEAAATSTWPELRRRAA
jgi:glyoxylase-like metal-dependent hydrolase (beta-lactamase superfamily II)